MSEMTGRGMRDFGVISNDFYDRDESLTDLTDLMIGEIYNEIPLSEARVLHLQLELNTDDGDEDVLARWGKAEFGIYRDVLVDAAMPLHNLHYAIQRLFGWQNSHLHHYEFPEDVTHELVGDSFLRWTQYCGYYFRTPLEDPSDSLWDDDFEEGMNLKRWLRSKYMPPFVYGGEDELYINANAQMRVILDENPVLPVAPDFEAYLRGERDIKMVPVEKVTLEQAAIGLQGELNRLIEHRSLGEYMCLKRDPEWKDKLAFASRRAATALDRWTEKYPRLRDKYEDAKARAKRGGADGLRAELEIRELDRMYTKAINDAEVDAIPVTNELIYKYDYGCGCEVRISLIDEYRLDVETGQFISSEGLLIAADNDDFYEILYGKPIECVDAEGLSVLDDVGGIYGYCEFLKGVHGVGEDPYEDKDETRAWGKSLGWTGRMTRPENML